MAVRLRSKRTQNTTVRHNLLGLINKGQETMGGIGSKGEDAKPVKGDAKSGKLPPRVSEDDDLEDGDIATPKRDRDDEQQDL
jgi:hypothetical protein